MQANREKAEKLGAGDCAGPNMYALTVYCKKKRRISSHRMAPVDKTAHLVFVGMQVSLSGSQHARPGGLLHSGLVPEQVVFVDAKQVQSHDARQLRPTAQEEKAAMKGLYTQSG